MERKGLISMIFEVSGFISEDIEGKILMPKNQAGVICLIKWLQCTQNKIWTTY